MKTYMSKVMKNSIRGRLLIYTLMLSILPLVLLSILVSFMSYNELKTTTIDFTVQSLNQIFDDLENSFEEAESISTGTLENADIQNLMRRDYQNKSELFSADLDGGMELALMTLNRPNIIGVYVLGNNQGQYKSSIYSFQRDSFLERDWYREILNFNDFYWFYNTGRSEIVKSREQEIISVGRPYIDSLTGQKRGVVIVDIDTSIINSALNNDTDDLKGYVLLDEDNNLLMASDNIESQSELMRHVLDEIGKDDTEQSQINSSVSIQTSETVLVLRESEINGWKLVGVVPLEGINRSTSAIIILAIVISVLFIGFNIAASYRMSRSFTTPIVELEEKMKSVQEGDFSVSVTPVGNDEFAHLARNFNKMVKEITDLMNEVHEKQQHSRKLEQIALQAQINPHFLYNSLDSIIWLLRMDEKDKAITMLKNLTILFRISLSKGNDIIAISREVQHIDSYLAIQSLRYSKKFDYDIHVPAELEEYKTIKLILQPLVENAIYHGISEEKSFIHIDILAEELGDHIKLSVRDNGVGMDEETLERLRETVYDSELKNKEIKDEGGYGLNNINTRIKLYFGEEYKLNIDSEIGVGTTISILIPKEF